jgi:hypothetical protein
MQPHKTIFASTSSMTSMILLTRPLSVAYSMSPKKLWAPQNHQLPLFLQGVKRRHRPRPLQPGSTGIVHIGTMAVDPSGPTAKVAVKLAFSSDEKSRLAEEHRIYSHLQSRSVQGIPRDVGLFVDEEPLLGTEGPHALVMTYAGVSLFRRYKLALDSVGVR